MKTYYDSPTQVVFSDQENEDESPILLGGIAFHEYVICGECGSVIELDEFKEGQVRELPWCSIDEEIRGDQKLDE